MYFTLGILVIVVFIESVFLLLGKERVVRIIKKICDEGSHANIANMNLGFCETEALDFRTRLKDFFQNSTLSGYEVNRNGWVNVGYDVSGMKIADKSAVKRAISIEVHTYLLENHGVDSWYHYIPILTEQMLLIKFAASSVAQEEFSKLRFGESHNSKDTVMLDD